MPRNNQLVRAANISGYCGLLKELGYEPEKVLRAANIDEHALEKINLSTYITAQLESELLRAATKATGQEHFAAQLGSRQQIEFLGLIAPIITRSATPRQVLQKIMDMVLLHFPNGIALKLRCYGDISGISSPADTYESRYAAELGVAQLIAVFRTLSNKKWRPTQVKLAHSAPTNISLFQAFFGDNILYDQPLNECLFSRAWLDQPISQTPTNLVAVARQASHQFTSTTQNFQATVERLICVQLPLGNCSADTIADKLAMHRRTLHRKLQRCGTSFTAILEDVRKDYAQQQLLGGLTDMKELAKKLGYADQSAFLRAFKRWNNITPLAWKKQNNAVAKT